MTLKYCIRYLLLIAGFAFLTFGMINWSRDAFSMQGIWFFDGPNILHPLLFVIIGVAMIPPAMWEIFSLGLSRKRPRQAQDNDLELRE